jgi:nicotinamidase-related amidase
VSNTPLSREVEIDPTRAALLFIDVQNYSAHCDGGGYAGLGEAEKEQEYGFFFRTLREAAAWTRRYATPATLATWSRPSPTPARRTDGSGMIRRCAMRAATADSAASPRWWRRSSG